MFLESTIYDFCIIIIILEAVSLKVIEKKVMSLRFSAENKIIGHEHYHVFC